MAAEAVDQALDFYRLDDLLTGDERAVRDRVRQFCGGEILPIITPCWERGAFPYAGSNEINTLVLGREIPGIPAFV